LQVAGLKLRPERRGPRFDTYAMTLQAALDGLGVAMGLRPYVADDLAAPSGRAVRADRPEGKGVVSDLPAGTPREIRLSSRFARGCSRVRRSVQTGTAMAAREPRWPHRASNRSSFLGS
jgi:DNA-binding transcriptional LysR family regulator